MDLAELSPWPGIDGRVALVTGASRGIGRAIARALGLQGAVVVGTATTQAGADAISQRLATDGLEGRGMVLDVGDPASVESLSKRKSCSCRSSCNIVTRKPTALAAADTAFNSSRALSSRSLSVEQRRAMASNGVSTSRSMYSSSSSFGGTYSSVPRPAIWDLRSSSQADMA